MSRIKQSRLNRQTVTVISLILTAVILVGTFYLYVRQTIQHQAVEETNTLIHYSQAALTEEDVSHFWASSVQGASYDVSTTSPRQLPEISWSNLPQESLTSSVLERLAKPDLDKTSDSWFNKQYVWVNAKMEGNQWILLRFPQEYFSDDWRIFWAAVIMILVMIICSFFIIYKRLYAKIHHALNFISDGLHKIEDNDYSFTYMETIEPKVDELGYQIESLANHLEKEHIILSASEQKLSLMLDHINLGVLVINDSGKIELFNPAAASLLKIDDSALGRSYETYIKSYLLANMIRRVMKDRTSLRDEIEMFVPNSKFIDVNIVPFLLDSGVNDDSILVLLYDISEIRRLETVRTEFVANASHELRTPVTAIKGFAETLLAGAIDTPEVARQFVEIIANESNRLEIIIHDILELSRVEKQSAPVTVNEFDIVEAAEASVEFFLAKAKAKKINLSIDASEPVMYKADRHRIEQIFTNLIDNAINYSEEESDIHIKIRRKRKGVQFSVSDNGIGIPEIDQERIFERFYRVDKGRSRNSGGTGLGLSIVRNLVKILNGKIEVESEVGVGSTFFIFLPY
ncbi:two-component system histidine kinase PnpS [Fundicoccus sp. Sow4_H7]|uniref:two-component system histidine kinase PnpS n=1 Tax=Fundicoccus sp. Sow4_H7 TaxID=3438784 RepID=UPI003F917D45